MLDKDTFGGTPAAQYLVSFLNKENNPKLSRAVSKRIIGFNSNVSEIVYAVEAGAMSSHVATNLLRLLRTEATQVEVDYVGENCGIIENLMRNIIIGKIKKAIRVLSIGSVVQRKQFTQSFSGLKRDGTGFCFTKRINDQEITVPVYRFSGTDLFSAWFTPSQWQSIDTTNEVLHERSKKRIDRRKQK